jgi:hypothetical protein
MTQESPRYTDEQMALILKRASELQARGEEPAHTLEAIQQIAQQAGIDPQFVADAAATVPAFGTPVLARLLGAPSAYRLSRRIPGTFLTGDHAALIATIRDHMPQVGEVKEVAGSFEWHAGPSDNKTAITFTPSSGVTVVRIDSRYLAPKFVLFLGATVVTLITGVVGSAVSPQLGVPLGLGMLALSFTSARSLWNRTARRARAKLERLLAALTEQLGRDRPDSSGPPSR